MKPTSRVTVTVAFSGVTSVALPSSTVANAVLIVLTCVSVISRHDSSNVRLALAVIKSVTTAPESISRSLPR